jgi:hypothetical protein
MNEAAVTIVVDPEDLAAFQRDWTVVDAGPVPRDEWAVYTATRSERRGPVTMCLKLRRTGTRPAPQGLSRLGQLHWLADEFIARGGWYGWQLPAGCRAWSASAWPPEAPVEVHFTATWDEGTLTCVRQIPEGGLNGNVTARVGS